MDVAVQGNMRTPICLKIGYIQATNGMDVHWFPSLAFGYLKSYMKMHLGDTVSMERLHSLEEIGTFDIVAVSSTSQDYEIARRIARGAKRLKENVITVLGGHHVTYLPGTMTREFDYGVLGEGEETFLDLVQHVFKYGPGGNPKNLRKIRGIAYHDGDSVAITAPRDPIFPLDRLPHPFRESRTAPYVMTSRGCPYRCAFCSSSAFWGKTRFFSAGYVVEEIGQILEAYPEVRNISIQDDLFVADTARFEEIVERLNAGGISRKASFSFAVRANLVTDRLCERMKELRLDSVCFGAESGSDRILANMKKGTSAACNQEALDLLHAHRIPVVCSFIVGWPTETEEEVRSTYEFLLGNIRAGKLTPASVVNILTPMPGTETWRDAMKNGAVPETDFDWCRLGIFASYKHSNAATLADWLWKRRTNNSVYLNERYLPQEGLYKIMSEFDDKIRALDAPPFEPAPDEPFPLIFHESALAHKYCGGRGLEIGGSAHNPFGLNALNVDMTDSMETVFKREEIRLCGRSLPVDIVAGGDAIPRSDDSQDFVVSSHVLEHFPNPIKALLEWDRLLRPGGVIFMIVPHKDRTFDREKARTPLQHLIGDYVKGNTEPHGDPNGHDHCWITEDVVELVRWMIENLGVLWEIIDVQDKDDKVGNGFAIVVRKQGSGIDALLSRLMDSVRCSQEALGGIANVARAAHVPVPVVERAIRGLSAERLSSKAALELGEFCFGVELYESAAGFFEQALLADPGNAEAMNDIGVLCHRLGEMELGREFFVRALAIAPESAEALSNLARLPARA
jgi:anaerobic magnesium-protoporphyrin IX monomethyl ester cyclase